MKPSDVADVRVENFRQRALNAHKSLRVDESCPKDKSNAHAALVGARFNARPTRVLAAAREDLSLQGSPADAHILHPEPAPYQLACLEALAEASRLAGRASGSCRPAAASR
jgi:hypothetical protein